MSGPDYYARVSPLSAGLRCKCPRCGQGPLFSGFLTVAARCSRCNLDLGKADSGDGPAVFMIFILGAAVVPLALWVESAFSPPLWMHAILWTLVILGGALAMLRPMKGVMIAYQFDLKASEGGKESYDD